MTKFSKEKQDLMQSMAQEYEGVTNIDEIKNLAKSHESKIIELLPNPNSRKQFFAQLKTHIQNQDALEIASNYLILKEDEYDSVRSEVKHLGYITQDSYKHYIQASLRLLESNDCWDKALGIIALTGKRTQEITFSGEFYEDDSDAYQLKFTGQLKQGEPEEIFACACLIPAKEVLKHLEVLRNDKTFQDKIADCENVEQVGDKTKDLISSKRVIKHYSGILPEEALKPRKLRNYHNAIILKRLQDQNPNNNIVENLGYCGKILGHLPYYKDESELGQEDFKKLATTMSYARQFTVKSNVTVDYITLSDIEESKERKMNKKLSMNLSLETKNKLNELKEDGQTWDELMSELVKAKEAQDKLENKKQEKGLTEKNQKRLEKAKSESYTKVKTAIDAVIRFNDSMDETSKRWQITSNLIRKLTGVRKPKVDEVLGEMAGFLENHHGDMRIMEENHNLKCKRGIKPKDELGDFSGK